MPVLGPTCGIAAIGSCVSTSGQTRKVVNFFAYQHIAGDFQTGFLRRLSDLFEATVWTPITALLSTGYVGVSYDLYYQQLITPPPRDSAAMLVNGGAAGGRLPLNVCVNTGMLTGLRGKSYRGMKRYGPVAESQVIGDELTAAAAASWSTATANCLTTLVDAFGDTWQPVVLSRQLSSAGPPLTLVGAPLSAVQLNKTLGMARHRRERTVR